MTSHFFKDHHYVRSVSSNILLILKNYTKNVTQTIIDKMHWDSMMSFVFSHIHQKNSLPLPYLPLPLPPHHPMLLYMNQNFPGMKKKTENETQH